MPSNARNSIFMIAGETSGDLLGANLARELLRCQPDLKLAALGGAQMRAAGVEIVFDNRSMDIIGWLGVLKNLRVIRAAFRTIKHILKNNPPDLLILIDYPGFNLRMAKLAKKYGIKVLYYVSPQIWAWKYGRIKTIQRCVDHMAVLFAFEEEIYRKENVPVTFVGHPLSALVRPTQSKTAVYQNYGFNPDYPVIALFPGSRRTEVQRLLPVMMSAVAKIRVKIPGVQFAIPLASNLQIEDLQPYLTSDIIIVNNDTYNLLSICSAAIVKSGTSTLEVALSQAPLTIIYKVNYINYWIARAVVRVRQIGLCNIVAQKTIAREFIQNAVTAENIAKETIRLIADPVYRTKILADLAILRARIGNAENSPLVAQIALRLII